MEVGAVSCDDCKGIWERESITFDETICSKYCDEFNEKKKGKRSGQKGTNR